MALRPSRRLRLRSRITLFFALGSALLAVVSGLSTYYATRNALLNTKESNAVEAAYLNAAQVKQDLRAEEPDIAGVLAGLIDQEDILSSIICTDPGECVPDNATRFASEDLPASAIEIVRQEQVATQYRRRAEVPILVIGIPLPAADAEYWEVINLGPLESTLRALAQVLVGAGAIAVSLGTALGRWASRRVLRPLGEVGAAAEAIAGDRLDTRLERSADPDLTRLVTSFNNMADTLQRRLELDARFASDVSHELRSPLMTLSASVEVLQKRRDEMSERSQAALDLLSDDVDRFQHLVTDLLEISRFDAGRAELQLSPVFVVEFLQATAMGNPTGVISVIADPELDELIMMLDRRRLLQVITNLLENAAKYAEGATAIHLRRVDDFVEIGIEDKGPGVAFEERSIIFDRFSRGSSSGRRGYDTGSGLGLSLVDEHVRLHGGSVRIEDRGDGASGSCFVVSLPYRPLDLDSDDWDAEMADGEWA